MSLPRYAAAASLVAASTVALALGCGSDKAEFNASAMYTPESLAQELVLRYADLNESGKALTAKGGRGKAAFNPASEKEQKKSGEAKKKPQKNDADSLLDDIVSKLREIPGAAPKQSCEKLGEAVRKDKTLDPKSREDLVKRIDEIAKEL